MRFGAKIQIGEIPTSGYRHWKIVLSLVIVYFQSWDKYWSAQPWQVYCEARSSYIHRLVLSRHFQDIIAGRSPTNDWYKVINCSAVRILKKRFTAAPSSSATECCYYYGVGWLVGAKTQCITCKYNRYIFIWFSLYYDGHTFIFLSVL